MDPPSQGLTSILGVLAVLITVGAVAGTSEQTGSSEAPATSASATTTQTTPASPPAKPVVDLTLSGVVDGDVVHRRQVSLRGTTTRGAIVTVNGHRAQVRRGRWRRTVSLSRGENELVVKARKAGADPSSTSITLTRKLSEAERTAIAERAAQRRAQAEANYKASATTIPYKQLNKDADAYRGKRVVYRGQIFQIQQEGALGGLILLSVTDEGYGFWTDEIWVDYDHGIKSAEDDIITVYGTVTGSKTYDTQIGGSRYVPRVHARYIDE